MHALKSLNSKNIKVDFIIDRKLAGQVFNGVNIISMEDVAAKNLEDHECIISLHNHYTNLKEIHDTLIEVGFPRVFSILRMRELISDFNLINGYWLDFSFSLDDFSNELLIAKSLLNDNQSSEIFDQVINFRKTGDLRHYPIPSLADEYTPIDLPRFRSPIRLIDCGAYNGAAIRKFENSGYEFEKILAFEPDRANYKKLLSNKTVADLKIFLPLATYSDDEALRFESNKEMGSKLNLNGDVFIQASKIDSIQTDFNPNLIKLDVEGAEIDTLIGAEKTIRKSRPNLCVAVYHKPTDVYEIIMLISNWDLGYKFYLRLHEHNTFGLVLYCFQDDKLE